MLLHTLALARALFMRLIGLEVVLALSLTLAPPVIAALTDAAASYTEGAISFPSGGLTLRAVLARPYGDGPFAAYVHVHGSVTPQDANTPPWKGLAEGSYLQILAREGYVVLRLARRGHFGSEGATYNYTGGHQYGGNNFGPSAYAVYSSIQTDANDVLAAVEYLRTRPFVDPDRVAVGGHSVGGIVSVLAGARDPKLRAVISLAGGFVWRDNLRGETSTPFVDSAWKESARTMNAPVLILWSKNDTNLDVDVGRDLEKRLRATGKRVEMIVYPPRSRRRPLDRMALTPRGLNDAGSRHAYPCRRVALSLSPSPPPNSIPPGRGRVECDEVELGCPPGPSEPARDESGQPGSGDGLVSNGV